MIVQLDGRTYTTYRHEAQREVLRLTNAGVPMVRMMSITPFTHQGERLRWEVSQFTDKDLS